MDSGGHYLRGDFTGRRSFFVFLTANQDMRGGGQADLDLPYSYVLHTISS